MRAGARGVQRVRGVQGGLLSVCAGSAADPWTGSSEARAPCLHRPQASMLSSVWVGTP